MANVHLAGKSSGQCRDPVLLYLPETLKQIRENTLPQTQHSSPLSAGDPLTERVVETKHQRHKHLPLNNEWD